MEYLGDTVVWKKPLMFITLEPVWVGFCTGKSSDLVNVMKLSPTLTVKASPNIGNQDLCSFQKSYLSAFELEFVFET